MQDPRLASRPEARTPTIEQLLGLVRAGRVRLPHFQRALRWRSRHVIALLDSIYRGFPISDLLLSQQRAPAAMLAFGPVRISVPERADAFFVIDGQQRVTALVGALLHPEQIPRGDIYAIWFDLEARSFQRLTTGKAPDSWIPLNVVADSARLLRWLREWAPGVERADLVDVAIELGKAFREYQVPAYIVEDASEQVLRLIFKRKNTGGVSMKEKEVFDALHGAGGNAPLRDACLRIAELGLGPLDEEVFLRCLQAVANMNPRHRLAEREEPVEPAQLFSTEEALGRVLTFLANDAGIPHVDLLPYQLPLQILSSFFHRHPRPSTRSRLLLSRWLWRGALSGLHADNGNEKVATLLRLIGEDEARSVQGLLEKAPGDRLQWRADLRAPWNVRSAATRIIALAILALRPRDPRNGNVIDIADFGQAPLQLFQDPGGKSGSAPSARRVVLPGEGRKALRVARQLLLDADDLFHGPSEQLLPSHALTPAALAALRRGDDEGFLRERLAILEPWFRGFCLERAGAGESDRPAIVDIVRGLHVTAPGP